MAQEGEYRVEVIADSSGKWCGNGLRYLTQDEAEDAARNLSGRWLAVRDWRVMRRYEDRVLGMVDVPQSKG